ncbi:hypothetical protein LTR78_004515 [Recurvomyces mirabilis]|uniref:Uncharacterized protein n=1 Tax=Recurvomyces mirabilis TaxID=574656 RepID=A0AAE0WPG0_9PEZI|nr:hypothetical protein LTR78_004515 [Recurvomyces mirabilis]KAK5152991.1 hypothetical protein LTS14_008099 [Recurvomyces mirabilis]
MQVVVLALLAFINFANALPVKRAATTSAADIVKISPATASCNNAPAAGECRNAEQAAPYIAISFQNFGINTFGEQAALLSLMLYESGNFQYSVNHYPGVPGQGTRNMQSPAFNAKYADYLANVCTNCGVSAAQVSQAQTQGPAAVLQLVNTDEWSFGSAAWFLATQCDPSVRTGLATGSQTAWEAYLQCVGTSPSASRNQIWSSAMASKSW